MDISGLGVLPQSRIQVEADSPAQKTVYTMQNAASLQAHEESCISTGSSGQLLDRFTSRREGYRSGYTKEDALTDLWRDENTRINLNDVSTFKNFKTHLTHPGQIPTSEELDALQKKLEEGGLSGEVDWTGLQMELDSFSNLDSEDLSDGLDYFASRYVAVRDKLERNFSGDAFAAQMEKLDAAYRQGTSHFVDGYAEKLGQHLGLSAEQTQGIRDSLQSHLDQKVASYQSALERMEAPEDPADAWLVNHDAYVASQLRGAPPAKGVRTEDKALYTLDDLTAAGKVAEAYQWVAEDASHAPNEVSMALDMAMIDMKSTAAIQSGKLSGGMAALLQSARESGRQAVIDTANTRLMERASNRTSGEPAGSFAPVDRHMLEAVYQKVMDTFHTGGNAIAAIHQGVETAKAVISEAHKQSPEVSRWGIRMETQLKDFYTPREASGLEKVAHQMLGSHEKGNSDFQNYADSWQHFLTTLNGDADSWYMDASGGGIPGYPMNGEMVEAYA